MPLNITEITKNRILLFDGAMGTMLQKSGLPDALPETYNLTHPNAVTAIHKQYVAAGAEVVTANTFQANTVKL
ncbi:MAG: homocysteine S-methyltransferase family protein, partial [Oscillospiraceae bacterium]|nr:homocysteine S-methyltransferase family protein [Oscillospiraceae bacterium]